MIIWAFDPGAVESGVAWLCTDEPYWGAYQYADPLKAWENVEMEGQKDDVVLIETYRGSGALTNTARETIEVVGFFKHVTRMGWGWGPSEPIMRVEQQRLSGRREAAQLMGGTIEALESDKNRKDAFSALAHCCAYRRGL